MHNIIEYCKIAALLDIIQYFTCSIELCKCRSFEIWLRLSFIITDLFTCLKLCIFEYVLDKCNCMLYVKESIRIFKTESIRICIDLHLLFLWDKSTKAKTEITNFSAYFVLLKKKIWIKCFNQELLFKKDFYMKGHCIFNWFSFALTTCIYKIVNKNL